MSAITQRVSNYLGGVSRQSDDKKLPNQVRECLNGYPDPTFGLTKRPGFKWIKNLGTGTTYDSSKWFYIHRDDDERYIGCIKPKPTSGNGDIDIWNATTGVIDISNASGDFIAGENITGSESSAVHQLKVFDQDNTVNQYPDNDNIEVAGDAILDFSEKNPFGTP